MSILDTLANIWDNIKQNVSNGLSQTYDTSNVDWGGGTGNAPTQERQTAPALQERYDTTQYDYGGYTSPTPSPTPTYNDYVNTYTGGSSDWGSPSSSYEPSYDYGPSPAEIAAQEAAAREQAAKQKAQQEIYDRFRLLDEENQINVNNARRQAAENQMKAAQLALNNTPALNTNIVPDFIRDTDTYKNLTRGSDAENGFTLGDLGNTAASNLVGVLQNITSDLPAGIMDFVDTHSKNVLNQIDRGQDVTISDVLNSDLTKKFNTDNLENTNAGDLLRNSKYTNSLLQAQQELAEASALNNSKIGEFVGSIASQAPSIAAGTIFGPAAALGMMGANVWGNSMQNSLDEEHTIDEAMRYGLLDAGKEILTEKLNPNIPGIDNLKLGDMFGEAAEEAIGVYLDPFVEQLAYGDNSSLKGLGKSLKTAWNEDFGLERPVFPGDNTPMPSNFENTLRRAAGAGLEGALSAGVIQSATHPVSTVKGVANAAIHPKQFVQNEYHAVTDKFTGQSDYTRAKDKFEKDLNVLEGQLAANPNDEGLKRQRIQALYDFEKEQRKLATHENLRSEDENLRRMAEQANIDLIETSAKATNAKVSQPTLNAIGKIANKLGVNVQFAEDVMFNDKSVGGLQEQDGTIKLNANATDPIETIFAHEIAHDTAGTQEYENLRSLLFQLAEENKIKTDGVDTIQESDLDQKSKDAETVATLVQNMFGDQKALEHFADKDVSTAKYIATQIKNFVTGDKGASDLARTQMALQNAINNADPSKLTTDNPYKKGDNKLVDVLSDALLKRVDGVDTEAQKNLKYIANYASQLLDPPVEVRKNDTEETIRKKKQKKFDKLIHNIEVRFRKNPAYLDDGIVTVEKVLGESRGNQGYITEEQLQIALARVKTRVKMYQDKGIHSIKTGYEDKELKTYNSEQPLEFKKPKKNRNGTPIEKLKTDNSNTRASKIKDGWAKTEFGYVWELVRANRKGNIEFSKNLERNGIQELDKAGIKYENAKKPKGLTKALENMDNRLSTLDSKEFDTVDEAYNYLNDEGFYVIEPDEFNQANDDRFAYEDGLLMAVPDWDSFEHKQGDELTAMGVFSIDKENGKYVIKDRVSEPVRLSTIAEIIGEDDSIGKTNETTEEVKQAEEPKQETPEYEYQTVEPPKQARGPKWREESEKSVNPRGRFSEKAQGRGDFHRITNTSGEGAYDYSEEVEPPKRTKTPKWRSENEKSINPRGRFSDRANGRGDFNRITNTSGEGAYDYAEVEKQEGKTDQEIFEQTVTPQEETNGIKDLKDVLDSVLIPETGDLGGDPLYGDVTPEMIDSIKNIIDKGEYPSTANRRLDNTSEEIKKSVERINESGNKPVMPEQELDTGRLYRRQLNNEKRQTNNDVSDEIFDSVERINKQGEETGEYPNTAKRKVNENISPEIEESVKRINESGNKPNMPEQELDMDRIARERYENGAVSKPIEKLTRARDLVEGQTFYNDAGRKLTFDGVEKTKTEKGGTSTRYLISEGGRQWKYTRQRIDNAIANGTISAKPFIPPKSQAVKWLSDQLGYNAYSIASQIVQNPESVNLSRVFFPAKDTKGALVTYPKNTEGYRRFQDDVYKMLGVENPYKDNPDVFETNKDGDVDVNNDKARGLEDGLRSTDEKTSRKARDELEDAAYRNLDPKNTYARQLAKSYADNVFYAVQEDERAYKIAGIDSEKVRKAMADEVAKWQLKEADNTAIDTQAEKGPDTKSGKEAQKLMEEGDIRTKHKVETPDLVKKITKVWFDNIGDNFEDSLQKAYSYFMAKEYKSTAELINMQDGNRMQYWLDQNAEHRKSFMEKNGITTNNKGVYMKDGNALDMTSDLGKQLQKIDDMAKDITLKDAQHGSTIGRALKQRTYFMSDKVLNSTKRALFDKEIDEINRQNRLTFAKDYERGKWKELEHVTDEEWRAFEDAETNKERYKALENIYKRIGENIPATFAETWFQQWRYMAMLANPRTHFKNINGNVGMQLLTMGKNAWAYAIEEALIKLNPDLAKNLTRYQSFSYEDFVANNSEMRKAVNDYYEENIKYSGQLGTGKYVISPTNYSKYRNFFHKSNWNIPGVALDFIAKGNNKLFQWEDDVFTGYRFKTEFSKLLRHNGYVPTGDGFAKDGKMISQEELDKFKEMALKEAKETTFHDESKFADLLNQMEKTSLAAKIIIGAEVPFKATPINIGKRMLEYQPVGMLTTIARGYKQVVNGEITANEYVNRIAKRNTGATLFALGLWMAARGMIRAHGDRDDDWKEENYKESVGLHQDYSFVVPKEFEKVWDKKSDEEIAGFLSLENLGPNITAMMMAAEVYEIYQNHGIWNDKKGTLENIVNIMDNVYPFLASMFQPLSDMSMMQGPVDTFESVANASSGGEGSEFNIGDVFLGSLAQHVSDTYVGQFFPSLFGAINRTTDPIVRTSYSPSVTETAFRKNLKKTILAYRAMNNYAGGEDGSYLEPLIDVRGKEVSGGDSLMERAINNFINPLDYKKNTSTDADRELLKLAEETDNTGIIPYNAKTVCLNDEAYKLSSKGRTEVNKKSLQAYQEEIKSFFDSGIYENLKQVDHEPIAAGILKDVKNHEVRMADADYFNEINLPGDSLINDKDRTVEFLKERGMFDYQTYDTLSIKNDLDADGETINNSGAMRKRILYDSYGVWDEIVKDIEAHKDISNYAYDTYGLNKTVLKMSNTQLKYEYEAMLEKSTGMRTTYDKLLKNDTETETEGTGKGNGSGKGNGGTGGKKNSGYTKKSTYTPKSYGSRRSSGYSRSSSTKTAKTTTPKKPSSITAADKQAKEDAELYEKALKGALSAKTTTSQIKSSLKSAMKSDQDLYEELVANHKKMLKELDLWGV